MQEKLIIILTLNKFLLAGFYGVVVWFLAVPIAIGFENVSRQDSQDCKGAKYLKQEEVLVSRSARGEAAAQRLVSACAAPLRSPREINRRN